MLGLGVLAVCINVALMLLKIGVGFLGNSYALIADGIESASDIFSSLITWAGFQFSLRPADDDHPFGHGKIEALAGLFSSCSLLGAATIIGWHSLVEIRTPHHAPAWFTLPVLIGVVIVKEYLSRKVLAASAAWDSAALKGDGWHHRSDAITSGAAALGIAVALIGGPGYEAADDWAALAACVVIVINAGMILKGSLHDILDGRVAQAVEVEIIHAAATTPGVAHASECRVRKSGVYLFVEIHIGVTGTISVAEGQDISDAVKMRLRELNLRIQHVLICVEPMLAEGASSGLREILPTPPAEAASPKNSETL